MERNLIKIIFSTASTGYLHKIIRFFVSLITLPLIISSLGKTEYGIYVLITQSVALLTLTDFGITNSVGRFISKYLGLDDNFKLNSVFNTSLVLLLIISFIILAITLLIADFVPVWLKIPDEYYEISRLLFLINGIFLFFTFPSRISQGLLAGKQLYPVINLISTISSILQLTGIIILSYLNSLYLLELTLLIISCNIINQLFLLLYSIKHLDFLQVKINNFSKSEAYQILSLGSSSFLISLSAILMSQGLIISVGIICDTELAGIFGVIMLIITNISFILTKISQPMVTISSELMSSGSKDKLFSLIIFVMRISFAISFFITISSFYFIDFIFRLLLENSWNDSDFIIVANSVIMILSAITIGIPQYVSRAVLQGSGYHWEASAAKIIATIISFSLGLYLMINDFGIIGASIAIALVWLLQGIFYFPIKISKFMGISLFDQIKKVYLPVIIFSIIIFFIPYLYNKILDINNVIALVICESLMLIILFLLINSYHKFFDNKYFLKIY